MSFQSSLDRGCFACECLLIPDSASGMAFWRRTLGDGRIRALLEERAREGGADRELIAELDRGEMAAFFERTRPPDEKEN